MADGKNKEVGQQEQGKRIQHAMGMGMGYKKR